MSFIFSNGGKLGISKPRGEHASRDKPGHQTVFIRTKNARADYERYKKLGLEFLEPYEEHDWGTFFAILDPDGNKLAYIEPPELPKPAKYTAGETNVIDLGPAKKIYKYPTPMRQLDIGRMVIDGRHPVNGFVLEHGCDFVMYVTKGSGRFCVGDEIYDVKTGDVVFVPTDHKFAAEGKFEYITVDSPAYYPEQTEEING